MQACTAGYVLTNAGYALTNIALTANHRQSSSYSLGTDPKENTVSKSASIVVCVFVTAEICLLNRFLAKNFFCGSTVRLSGVMSQYLQLQTIEKT
jgi:hypothetical protein